MLTLKLGRAAKRAWPASLKSEISNLKSLAESCSRPLSGWADSLQNSDIKGQRHLTDKSRREDEQKKRCLQQGIAPTPSAWPSAPERRRSEGPHLNSKCRA